MWTKFRINGQIHAVNPKILHNSCLELFLRWATCISHSSAMATVGCVTGPSWLVGLVIWVSCVCVCVLWNLYTLLRVESIYFTINVKVVAKGWWIIKLNCNIYYACNSICGGGWEYFVSSPWIPSPPESDFMHLVIITPPAVVSQRVTFPMAHFFQMIILQLN